MKIKLILKNVVELVTRTTPIKWATTWGWTRVDPFPQGELPSNSIINQIGIDSLKSPSILRGITLEFCN